MEAGTYARKRRSAIAFCLLGFAGSVYFSVILLRCSTMPQAIGVGLLVTGVLVCAAYFLAFLIRRPE